MEFVSRYRVLREVAQGGMGVVLEAEAEGGRRVAVKLLRAGTASSAAQRQRFASEVRSLLRLDHPGVVRILDAGEERGSPFLVTEWIEGESLEERLRRGGPLDPRAATEVVRRVASALEHCHASGILHRDLKPGNVLIRRSDGVPLLTDFGLALDLEAAIEASRQSLEVRRWGLRATGRRSRPAGSSTRSGRDRTCSGSAVSCSRVSPVDPHTPAPQSQESSWRSPPLRPPPSAFALGLPRALDALCLRLLARLPDDRPPSARAVAEELESWTGRPGRPPTRLVVGLVVALSLLGGVAVLSASRTASEAGTGGPGPPNSGSGRSTGAEDTSTPTDAQAWTPGAWRAGTTATWMAR